MATTAEDYLITEGTKYLGKSLETLDKIKEEMSKIDLEFLAENHPDLLSTAHEGLKTFNEGINMQMVVMMILAMSSSPKENSNA